MEPLLPNSPNRLVRRRTLLGGAAAAVGIGAALGTARAASAGVAPVSGSMDASIDGVASRLGRGLVALRRDIHRHPEVAGQEERTAAVVAKRLRAAGLDVTTAVGGYGVLGILEGARRGRTVAYRADMDAVPADGQIDGGPEPAHLCGHDMHTTIGVGVAEVLARLRERVAGTVVFVFQPAEEALSGAEAMLEADVFADVRPAEIHALHTFALPVGQFAVTPGYGLPGRDSGTVTLTGPDAAGRARRLAAEIGELGTVPRPTTPADLERLVAELQLPEGPLAEFVFMQVRAQDATTADRAAVELVFRCWPEQRYLDIRRTVHRLARSYGAASVSFPHDPFPAMVCPEREGRAVRRYLRRTLGRHRVRTLHAAVPYSGEDFSLFLDQMPGTYTLIGVRTPGTGIETSYPHYGSFTPDERAIGYGVRAMAGWLATRARGA